MRDVLVAVHREDRRPEHHDERLLEHGRRERLGVFEDLVDIVVGVGDIGRRPELLDDLYGRFAPARVVVGVRVPDIADRRVPGSANRL